MYMVKPYPRTHLSPAEINPAYGAIQVVEEDRTWPSVTGALALPQFIAVIYAARKNDHGWLASIGLGFLANMVMTGISYSPLGPAALAVPAATGYFAYKAYKGS